MDYDPKKNRLKDLRNMNDLYQKDMAEKLGMGVSTYINFENGYREMKIGTLLQICEMFEVSADWLLGLNAPDDWKIR